MSIITLTSDFGLDDHYLSVIKGGLLSNSKEITIVDITHNIENYNIVQAAYALKNAYPHFPEGTIHLVSVNNFSKVDGKFIAVREGGHYFIGPDNGMFSLVFNQIPDDIFTLPFDTSSQFRLKDIFSGAVAHILSGKPFNEIGLPAYEIEERITLNPVITSNRIKGSVVYIDNYENAIVNISRQMFDQACKGRSFEIYFKRFDPISTISVEFHDVSVGEVLCRFNSTDQLEIAIYMGKASSMLGLNVEDAVEVEFLENKNDA